MHIEYNQATEQAAQYYIWQAMGKAGGEISDQSPSGVVYYVDISIITQLYYSERL